MTGTSVDRKAVDTSPIPRNLDLIFVYETSASALSRDRRLRLSASYAGVKTYDWRSMGGFNVLKRSDY